jgi:hypothetical protein
MKSLTKILFAALLLLGINSAFADTQDRHLSGFHALNLTSSFDVYITQGSTESVKVDAPSDIINRIITEVNGDVLTVRTKNETFNWGNWFSNNHKKIIIYVSVKDIRGISISGSSDVFFKDGLHADKLELKISGSGDVTGKLNVKDLECGISGSGDIVLAGTAQTSTVSINGSGDFKARELVTAATTIRVSGSGDATVNATQKLEARVSGSGDIRYTGGANHVSTSSSGSGDVHKF